MRIIAGLYRGRVIKSPSDGKTRPTSDRLRETLFNILNPQLQANTRFLDLCAGTGAIGIEAISRGVANVAFVDISRNCCRLIEENLDLLKVSEKSTEVLCADAVKFLRRTKIRWDIIYYDPPYDSDYQLVLDTVGSNNLLPDNGVLVVEHWNKNQLRDEYGEIRRWRIVKQGNSVLSFFERN